MLPAQQRLEAGDAVRGEIDQRLVVQLEFAIGKGAPQVDLHVTAFLRLQIHFALEEMMHAAAVVLGAVQRHVGVAHQLFAVVAVAGRQRDADAGADHDLDAVHVIGFAQRVDQPQRKVVGVVGRNFASQHDRKFVAAESRHQIAAADIGAHPRGHHGQQPVAHRVTEGIVDVLEKIEVDAQHRDAAFGTDPDLLKRLAQPLLIHHAVGEARQAVVMRHVRDAGLRLATLGDVHHGDEKAVAALERHPAAVGQNLDLAAICPDVPPVALRLIGVADLLQRPCMRVPFILRPDLPELHGEKGGAIIAVMRNCSVIDAKKVQRLRIEHPHRHRVGIEQQPERFLAALDVGDVRDRQG